MNRLLAVGSAAVLVVTVTGPAADAAKKKPKKRTRTVTMEYTVGAGVYAEPAAAHAALCSVGGFGTASCFKIPLKSDEKYVKLVATDGTGHPVGVLWQDGSSPKQAACGKGALTLKKPGQLAVYVAPRVPDCPVASTGKVVATISTAP